MYIWLQIHFFLLLDVHQYGKEGRKKKSSILQESLMCVKNVYIICVMNSDDLCQKTSTEKWTIGYTLFKVS